MSKERLLLGWDTATPTSGLVLMEGNKLLAAVEVHLDKSTTSKVFTALDALLKLVGRERGDVKAMGLVKGPGSFTGIRLAAAAAKGLALSLKIPFYPCTTTEALARVVPIEETLLSPTLDARRGQGYGAIFRWRAGKMERLTSDMALDVDKWREMEEKVLFLGPGVKALGFKGLHPTPTAALGAALLAFDKMKKGEGGANPLTSSPLYIRPSDAETNKEIRLSPWD